MKETSMKCMIWIDGRQCIDGEVKWYKTSFCENEWNFYKCDTCGLDFKQSIPLNTIVILNKGKFKL